MNFKLLFSMVVLMFLTITPVHAEQLGSREGVYLDKKWIITLNTSIQESSLEGNVYVKQEGASEPLEQETLLVGPNKIAVKAPEKGYLPSENYTLSIDGIISVQGASMEEKVTFDFSTVSEENLSLDVHVMDVGQGDSILVEYPNGNTMLVDGGTRSAGEQVVSYLKKAGVTSIDQVVSTHPDADHLGGLIPVLESMEVKSIIDSGKTHTTQTYEEYLSLVEQKEIPFLVPSEGDYLNMHPTITTKVLNVESKADENNESSIVLKLTYGDNDVLLTGDAGVQQEQEMMNEFNVEAEILKAGHHGADTSSSLEFLKSVDPDETVLSYGAANSYGHPAETVVNNLRSVGSTIYSTAESGNVVFSIQPYDYTVSASPWSGEDQSSTSVEPNAYPINVNEADSEKLQLLDGIGPEIAKNIIEYRTMNGPFQEIDELIQVPYIGPEKLEDIRPYITLG